MARFGGQVGQAWVVAVPGIEPGLISYKLTALPLGYTASLLNCLRSVNCNLGLVLAFGVFFKAKGYDKEAPLGGFDDFSERRAGCNLRGSKDFGIGGQLLHYKAVLLAVGILVRVEVGRLSSELLEAGPAVSCLGQGEV